MADRQRRILICSCEDTMPLDADAVRRALRGVEVQTARHLCRAELESFKAAARNGELLIVGCTQEAPLFSEVAENAETTFVNVRETGGWSRQAAQAGPKMAALIAAAAEPTPDYSLVSFESDGVALFMDATRKRSKPPNFWPTISTLRFCSRAPITVTPPRVVNFPIVKGTITSAKGYLGAFELTVGDFAAALPSSRGAMRSYLRATARSRIATS